MRSSAIHFIYIFLVTLVTSAVPNFVLGSTERSLDRIIQERIHGLTLEQKVGQLFIVGFPQTQLTPQLQNFLQDNKPGAFILFKRNISSLEQIKTLNQSLYRLSYSYSQLPPLIAVDQEGGAVSRLPIEPPLPHALALGKTESSELAFQLGQEAGRFLGVSGSRVAFLWVTFLWRDKER